MTYKWQHGEIEEIQSTTATTEDGIVKCMMKPNYFSKWLTFCCSHKRGGGTCHG